MLLFSLLLLACTPAPAVDADSGSPPAADDGGSATDTGHDTGDAAIITLRDLAYPPPPGVDDALATLDLIRLDDGVDRPLVVLIHGGSWVGGDKRNFEEAAPAFVPWWLDRGYTVAAVNFRLATPLGQPLEVGPRDQARDIAHALAWLDEHAAEHGISPGAAVAVGYSSGAHLVALLGADARILAEPGLGPSHLAATVSLDVHAYDVPYALELMVGSTVEQNIPLIEHLFGGTEAEQLDASPIAYIDGQVAPAMLVSVEPSLDEAGTHGHVAGTATAHYAEALLAIGHTAVALHDEDETHATLATGFGEPGDRVTEAVGAFLDGLP